MITNDTDRLVIHEFTPMDTEAVYRIFSDPVTMSFWPAPYTWEQTERWVEGNIRVYPSGFGRLAVVLKSSSEIIGDCGIVRAVIDGQEENDLGYIIHHPYWGQGYGTEAAQAVLEYGFKKLGLTRICANMPTDHLASRRVAEKLGMTLERTFNNPKNRDIETCLYCIEIKF